MRLGIDIGGTHTDAVLVKDTEIRASAKAPTRHDNLIASIRECLEQVLKQVDGSEVAIVNLSTTLCTNAIVEHKLEPVGMFVSGGPGIPTSAYALGDHFTVLSGSIDHRGYEIQPLPEDAIEKQLQSFREQSVRVFGVVTKFSPRNPAQELSLQERVGAHADFVTLGHNISGSLNFPRRIATVYFNSAVWRRYNSFLDAVVENLEQFGISCQVNGVKADGGTMPLALAREIPVQSIFSGPSASIMGIMALCPVEEDTLVLDIGGTTTDIAVFASGVPLLEPDGISIASRPTLVRALRARSIGVGGDSALRLEGDALTVGPDRLGPSMAAGGSQPTLTDALNVLKTAAFMNAEKSRIGMTTLAAQRGVDAETLSREAVKVAASAICAQCRDFLDEINTKPVYTLHELLQERLVAPRSMIIMGGPAKAMAPHLQECFKIPVTVPPAYDVANAVGAAMTGTTLSLEIHADTPQGTLVVPSLGIHRSIPRSYSLDDGIRDARELLMGRMAELGLPIQEEDLQITQASSFNMVDGFATLGRNIRVRCQTRPGVVRHLY
ncbi:MAG: hydantoinase/oxoprolinase family protein [Desulfovibrionales bacterium]